MLKKLLIATAILATSSTIALAGAPYVGVGLGVNNFSSKLTDTDNTINKFGARSALVNVFGGYGALVNQTIYLGGEVFFTEAPATAKVTSSDGDYAKLTSNYSYGISFIPGVMLSEHTMAYLRAGIVRGHFNSKASADGAYASKSQNATGGQLGLGLQTSVSQNIDLRGEYVYTSYRSFNVAGTKVSSGTDQFTLAAIYKFD